MSKGYKEMKVNRLDCLIMNIYKDLKIMHIHELNIKNLGKAFKVPICYTELGSAYIRQNTRCVILVDSTKELHLQKEEFYHELSHFILDHHLCDNKMLIDYFEAKADNLVPYLAIPLHMLNECDLKSPFVVQELSQSFGVSYDLVFKRLEQIKLYSKE